MSNNLQSKCLQLYLPSNVVLLTAVAMMVAGWENGPEVETPGFPNNGKWEIKWEGLKPMP